MKLPLAGVNWIGFVLLGVAVLWAAAMFSRRFRRRSDLLLALTCFGWVMIWLGLLGPILTFAGGPFVAVILGVVAAMTVHLYRETERRSLLWLIGTTVRHGIPMSSAVRAFAHERWDEIGWRAERLAAQLEAGIPLSEALVQSGNRLPDDAMLAASLVDGKYDFAELLEESSRQRADLLPEWSAILTQLYYVTVTGVFFVGVYSFVMIRIVPTIQQIMMDFETPPSQLMEISIRFAEWTARFGMVLAPLAPLLLGAIVIGTLYYIGWLRWEPPWIRRLTAKYHGAVIMRALAQYAKAGLPLPYALSQLAHRYPRPYVQRRLVEMATAVANGQDWCEELYAHQLVGRAETRVLQSAQQVGNLEWALREMSERSMRRLSYRLRLALRFILPLYVILISVPIAVLAMGLMQTLAEMIKALA